MLKWIQETQTCSVLTFRFMEMVIGDGTGHRCVNWISKNAWQYLGLVLSLDGGCIFVHDRHGNPKFCYLSSGCFHQAGRGNTNCHPCETAMDGYAFTNIVRKCWVSLKLGTTSQMVYHQFPKWQSNMVEQITKEELWISTRRKIVLQQKEKITFKII